MEESPMDQDDAAAQPDASQFAQYHLLWQQLLEAERRKSPDLPILWGHHAYSQNEEDGILQEILRRVGITNRTFIEIGVGNGLENNTLFWLKQQWQGAWIEAAGDSVAYIRKAFAEPLSRGQLHLRQALVSCENVDALIATTPFNGGEIDLLSIDIDGNDCYVFDRMRAVNPRVVAIEYNALFPPPARWRLPYDPGFVADGSERFGSSLETINETFERRGYSLVGCNITGSNAFFVRHDLLDGRFPCVGETRALWQPPRYYLTGGLFQQMRAGTPISLRFEADCR
jgi:hypothetical protein